MHYILYDIAILSPEITLIVSGLLMLLYGSYVKNSSTNIICYFSIAAIILSLYYLLQLFHLNKLAFSGTLQFNSFNTIFKFLILISSLIIFGMLISVSQKQNVPFEVPVLLIFSMAGALLVVSSNDLLVLYLSLELMSLCLYILVAYDRDNVMSSEAAIKYFVLGSLASGLYLFGSSIIYGFSDCTIFNFIEHYYTNVAILDDSYISIPIGFLIGVILIITALFFKISVAPLHMWAPDVYQGSTTIITTYLASVPKIAVVGLLIRVLYQPFIDLIEQWQQILIFAAIASMLIGSLGALMQRNVKRLLAYSSISHMGFILMGITAGEVEGIQSTINYIIVYIIMILSVFSLLLMLRKNNDNTLEIKNISNLAKTHPLLALAMSIIMLSMAGIPPFAGFFAKFYVLLSIIQQEMYYLAIVAVIVTIIGSFYYLRIIKIMYFDDITSQHRVLNHWTLKAILVVGVCFNLLYVLLPEPLLLLTKNAALSIFNY